MKSADNLFDKHRDQGDLFAVFPYPDTTIHKTPAPKGQRTILQWWHLRGL
jgi:hypothetical protein